MAITALEEIMFRKLRKIENYPLNVLRKWLSLPYKRAGRMNREEVVTPVQDSKEYRRLVLGITNVVKKHGALSFRLGHREPYVVHTLTGYGRHGFPGHEDHDLSTHEGLQSLRELCGSRIVRSLVFHGQHPPLKKLKGGGLITISGKSTQTRFQRDDFLLELSILLLFEKFEPYY